VTLPQGAETIPGEVRVLEALGMQRVAAALALDEGNLPLAHEWLEVHDHWLDWSGAVLGRSEGAALWARYHRQGGEAGQAQQYAERARTHATDPRQPLALLAAHRLLGELDIDTGTFDDAAYHLDTALALADACAAPYERALTVLALAELRMAEGDAGEARTLLNAARAMFVALGANPALARADAFAARLDVASATPPTYPAGLSAREVEVLRLVAEGLSNPQIGERLFLSPRTVEHHLHAIFNKTGVSSRAAAARWASERALG
jgi:ATP/maltotriose-dependent transcriptional regulator MalT